ncbi:hypothetical protein, partial [Amycolatopsis lurida]|uniref:hypothetical protein n=1 Tax=Amycolatopsis lurida TaxID=31959 RepID=UPI00365054B1
QTGEQVQMAAYRHAGRTRVLGELMTFLGWTRQLALRQKSSDYQRVRGLALTDRVGRDFANAWSCRKNEFAKSNVRESTEAAWCAPPSRHLAVRGNHQVELQSVGGRVSSQDVFGRVRWV